MLATERAETIDHDYRRRQRLTEQRDRFALGRARRPVRDFDPGVACNAMTDFEPAIPTTSEGVITAAVGFFLGGGRLHLLA